jgi:hypothetical protein
MFFCHAVAEIFPFAVLSTAKGKYPSLRELCASSEVPQGRDKRAVRIHLNKEPEMD